MSFTNELKTILFKDKPKIILFKNKPKIIFTDEFMEEPEIFYSLKMMK